jgi:hypothetical protein
MSFVNGELVVLINEGRNGHLCGGPETDTTSEWYLQALRNYRQVHGRDFDERGDTQLVRDYAFPNGFVTPIHANEIRGTGWAYNDFNTLEWFCDGVMNIATIGWDDETYDNVEALRDKLSTLNQDMDNGVLFEGFNATEVEALSFVNCVMQQMIEGGLPNIARRLRERTDRQVSALESV